MERVIIPRRFINLGRNLVNIFLRNINQNHVRTIVEEDLMAMILQNSVTDEHISYSLTYDEVLDVLLDGHSPEEFFEGIDSISVTIGYSVPNPTITNLQDLVGDNTADWERKMLNVLMNVDGFRLTNIDYMESPDEQQVDLNFSIVR